MNCTGCGAALEANTRFCGDCGTPVASPIAPKAAAAAPPQSGREEAAQMPYQQAPPPVQAPGTPIVPASQSRVPVNPGLCALLSFLWPGAGFFLMQKVGLAVAVILSVVAFDLIVNGIGALMMGVGLVCTIPISIVVHIAVIIWNYRAAVAYNAGT